MPLKAVEPRRIYRQIAEQIRGLIDIGEFPAGARLPSERELAESLGVSRPSVREALIALELEGLVSIKVGSGIYVLGPSENRSRLPTADFRPEGPFDVLHAREIVEGSIAAEAATLARPDHIAALDRVLARMDRCRGQHDAWIALDCEFHLSIAAVLENSVLEQLVGHLFNKRINPYFMHLASYFEDESTWRQALAEHKAIRNALSTRAPEAARLAMRQHLMNSQKRFSQGFGEPARLPDTTGANEPAIGIVASSPRTLRSQPIRRKQR